MPDPKYEPSSLIDGWLANGWLAEVRSAFRDGTIGTLTDRELIASLDRRERSAMPALLGYAPKLFLRRWRVDYALWLIHVHRRPVIEGALSAGFYDSSHLNRATRQIIGCSPTRFAPSNAAAGELRGGRSGKNRTTVRRHDVQ